ncbi:enoyl-CoA hydratase-related protein [Mobilicoccus caccae]|uniref:Enoyl-CoA hydratase n=1 Tax=Mobilicoccus caccae TaxID=1859295 RepID=A0ABQ6IRN3_9MICO|nr:enoyl-CoA hydratase-related protein [Mobilicoccus caccae]GMA40599.1 enoyl-CoA hydratase [Mobilicoccus caccae]
MSTTDLVIDRAGPVVTVTFDRPHRRNAFTTEMYLGLRDLATDLADDPESRVVVFRGAGGTFAAGNDIAEFVAMTSGAEAVEYEARVRDLMTALAALPQVSIAAIDGACVGGGLALATHCDLRIATARSRFGYPIARTLGNALSRPLLERCVHVFGESVTRQMLLTSRLLPAERAYGVGALLTVCEDAGALAAELEEVVQGLLAAAPLTLRTTKRQLGALTEIDPTGGPDDAQMLEEVYGSAGFREGVRAFVARETPRFADAERSQDTGRSD